MAIKTALFYVGCAATWVFVLPVLAVCGFVALVGYAALSQLGDFLRGSDQAPDADKARAMAHRMCALH